MLSEAYCISDAAEHWPEWLSAHWDVIASICTANTHGSGKACHATQEMPWGNRRGQSPKQSLSVKCKSVQAHASRTSCLMTDDPALVGSACGVPEQPLMIPLRVVIFRRLYAMEDRNQSDQPSTEYNLVTVRSSAEETLSSLPFHILAAVWLQPFGPPGCHTFLQCRTSHCELSFEVRQGWPG